MACCCVYRYTNKENGKTYIGRTVDLYVRKRQHENPTGNDTSHQYNSEFHTDLRELGTDKFEFEILEICSPEELNDREEYWIEQYQSNKGGYNILRGRSGGWVEGKHVKQIDKLTGQEIQTYPSIRSAARAVGVNAGDIKRVCIGKLKSVGGFFWQLEMA